MYKYTFILVSTVLLAELVRGQPEQCTGSGCSCTMSYECCLQVRENVPIGTYVGNASIHTGVETAARADNAVYVIASPVFEIDRVNGSISTKASLDRESTSCYTFQVNVQGDTPFFTIFAVDILDANDHIPSFRNIPGPIEISIPETTSSKPTIDCNAQATRSELNLLLADDMDAGDNALISYSLQGSSVLSIPDPATLCIQNSEPLDRDDPNYQPYEFILIATDNGNPANSANVTVIMSLEGIDESRPTFQNENIKINVSEGDPPGTVVYQFQARDSDRFDSLQPLRYAINPIPSFFPLVLNESTGDLILNQTVDAESDIFMFEFTVEAFDLIGPGQTSVVLTVTDVNEPASLKVRITSNITENRLIGQPVVATITVEDTDREQNNNSILLESGREYFEVSSLFDSGRDFSIRQIEAVDREAENPIQISLRLIEGEEPIYMNQTRTLYIYIMDVNDNPPTLNLSSLNYDEDDESGFVKILSISQYVVDRDEGVNAEVSSVVLIDAFDSNSVSMKENFTMYQDNGIELGPSGTLMAPPIDREVVGDIITITVMITDGGEPPMSNNETFTLRILDLNDNAPVFKPESYDFNITENRDSGIQVGRVLATDPDNGPNGTVRYSLSSGTEYFSIHEESGMITSKIQFDRENISSINITVSAVDLGEPPLNANKAATVRIKINDVNDNPPVFNESTPSRFEITTNTPVGTRIGTVEALDKDDGVNAVINYSFKQAMPTSATYFAINDRGEITLESPIDTKIDFNLTVIASNPGSSANTTELDITIIVTAPFLSTMEMIIISCVGGVVLLIIVLLIILIFVCCCCRRRTGKYSMTETKDHLNNHPERVNSITKPILKSVPAAPNGTAGSRERTQVSFSTRVDETHYKPEGAVTDNTKVMRKASITNFGSSDESPQVPCRDSPVHNGSVPMQVLDYENSPGEHMNGMTNDMPGLHPRYEMRHLPSHNSPMHIGRDMTDNAEFSQTSSTTDANDSEEEESTFSDGASNMNTSIPCFAKEEDLHRYGAPPPQHTPLYPHIHTSHMPSPSLLGIIHPGNMSSLAAPEGSYSGNNYTTHHSQTHSTSSSQTTTPSPHPRHQMMPRMDPRPHHSHTNGHDYSSRKLIMPDAYPQAIMPDMLRHTHDLYTSSLSDYGEASTYASIELDEALNCNIDPEAGFFSLTATDYDEHEDT